MDAFKTTTVPEILIVRITKLDLRVIRQNYGIFWFHKMHFFFLKKSQEFTSVLTSEGKIVERSLSTPANYWVRLVNCSVLRGEEKNSMFYVRTGMTFQDVCQLIYKLLYYFSYKRSHLSKTKILHNAKCRFQFDVYGSVHHSIIHIGNPTKCHSVTKFYFIL